MQQKSVKMWNLIKTPLCLGRLDLIYVVVLQWASSIKMHGFFFTIIFPLDKKNESCVHAVIPYGVNALCRAMYRGNIHLSANSIN